jgi:hypothetical protein
MGNSLALDYTIFACLPQLFAGRPGQAERIARLPQLRFITIPLR